MIKITNIFKSIYKKIIPSLNAKKLREFWKIVHKIDALEPKYSQLSDSELQAKTVEFRKRLENGETLDDLLIEAFATVRETSRRVLGKFHFQEQLLGGISLHKGMMAEMKTGEGKTLVAALPSYLNALTGKGVHVVTVNDYLAKRDADEIGQIHRFLGLSTGCILETLDDVQRKRVYACDVVYATNNQLGFDYLRDNMKYEKLKVCQRGLNYAIIDEADSVLIDEARTPLIISGPSDRTSDACAWIAEIIEHMQPEDYEKDEKMRTATLTEVGIEKLEGLLRLEGMLAEGGSLYEVDNIEMVHGINQALRAKTLYKRDIDYMVKDGKVLIIDEFTGRILDGRRYSDGLHQAIEAKERVEIQMENQTMASITFQKYFALYNRISGMSGTCIGESEEFKEIYKVETIAIPTHMPMIRKDMDDEIYRTFEEKFDAILAEIKKAQERQQPVLLVTGSIEASDVFSKGFTAQGFKHQVLNARYHKEEAEIISEAGVPGGITIATNMAGRGTDIQLGGNLQGRINKLRLEGLSEAEIEVKIPQIRREIEAAREVVLKAGGLYVVGTERNESRRVDDQARGRSGRQGDPGQSKFFLSLDDSLIRIFGSSDRLAKWLVRLGLKHGEAITHPYISRAIEKAQNSVEARNFDWRKNVFKYDQVLDEQRRMIYKYRNKFLGLDEFAVEEGSVDTNPLVAQLRMFTEYKLDELKSLFLNPEIGLDLKDLHQECVRLFGLDLDFGHSEDAFEDMKKQVMMKFDSLSLLHGSSLKMILLQILDDLWKDHLHMLDILRQNVNLKAYAQKDPLNEYKKEAFLMFERLLNRFRDDVLAFFFHLSLDPAHSSDRMTGNFVDIDKPETDFNSSDFNIDEYLKSLGDLASQAEDSDSDDVPDQKGDEKSDLKSELELLEERIAAAKAQIAQLQESLKQNLEQNLANYDISVESVEENLPNDGNKRSSVGENLRPSEDEIAEVQSNELQFDNLKKDRKINPKSAKNAKIETSDGVIQDYHTEFVESFKVTKKSGSRHTEGEKKVYEFSKNSSDFGKKVTKKSDLGEKNSKIRNEKSGANSDSKANFDEKMSSSFENRPKKRVLNNRKASDPFVYGEKMYGEKKSPKFVAAGAEKSEFGLNFDKMPKNRGEFTGDFEKKTEKNSKSTTKKSDFDLKKTTDSKKFGTEKRAETKKSDRSGKNFEFSEKKSSEFRKNDPKNTTKK